MASKGVRERDVPPVVPIHGLKELLKESLTEILRENQSLLQTEQSRGKCSYRPPLRRPRTRGVGPRRPAGPGGVVGGHSICLAWRNRRSECLACLEWQAERHSDGWLSLGPTAKSGVLSQPFSLYPPLSLPSFPHFPLFFFYFSVTLCNGLQAHWVRCQMAIRWRASGSILSSQKRLLRGRMRVHPPWGPAVTGNLADAGGADGGHPGTGRLEDPKKSETPKKGEATAQPFILSEGLPSVPATLVARILWGDFVDMAELLHDNLVAQRGAPCRSKKAPLHPLQLARGEKSQTS